MSKQEFLFKSLISKLICSKVASAEEREKRLLAFHGQSELYYDVFCDSIYILATNPNANSIFLDEFGYTHFECSNPNVFVYELLRKEDIISCNDDIILYVDLALGRLQCRLDALNKLSVIKSLTASNC